jgi:hypothetical protein
VEGFSSVTLVTGLNRPNTGKEDDDDDDEWWWLRISRTDILSSLST